MSELSTIEAEKFKQMVTSIGAETIQAISTSGPEMQVRVWSWPTELSDSWLGLQIPTRVVRKSCCPIFIRKRGGRQLLIITTKISKPGILAFSFPLKRKWAK